MLQRVCGGYDVGAKAEVSHVGQSPVVITVALPCNSGADFSGWAGGQSYLIRNELDSDWTGALPDSQLIGEAGLR